MRVSFKIEMEFLDSEIDADDGVDFAYKNSSEVHVDLQNSIESNLMPEELIITLLSMEKITCPSE